MSSENHLSMITWNSTHFNGTDKHKEPFHKLMSTETEEEFNNSIKQISLATIRKLVETGLALVEYCSKYGGTVNDLTHMALIIKDEHPELYAEFTKLCKEPSEEFYTYIKWVVMTIKAKGQAFDIFDYCYFTKLRPLAFKNVCKKILKDSDYAVVRSVVNKFEMYAFIDVDMEIELNGSTFIKGREISREEKEQVFKFLDAHNIPYFAYKSALRKYVEGDERIMDYLNPSQKQKHRRRR